MSLWAAAFYAVALLAPHLGAGDRARWAGTLAAGAASADEIFARAVTVKGESDYRAQVERCEIVGNGGELTAWQIRGAALGGHSRAEVCTDPGLAARLGAGKLRAEYARHGGDWHRAIAGYLGNVSPQSWRAAARIRDFERLRAGAAP